MKKKWLRSAVGVALLTLLATGAWAASIAGYTPKSENPLRYRIQLGADEKSPKMLVVLDESQGTGKGYDIAIADANLNGKLDDEKPVAQETPVQESYARISVSAVAPFREVDSKAKYECAFYVMKKIKGQKEPSVSVIDSITLQKDGKEWNYMLLPGPKAIAVDPKDAGLKTLTLGTPLSMTVTVDQTTVTPEESTEKTKSEKSGPGIAISSTIKDEVGQTLRRIQIGKQKEVKPHLVLKSAQGKEAANKDLEYG
jgi:hypothetical protein